jgi:hypothetical protein
MSRSKCRVEDYEYGLEVKARWMPIVQAAGLYSEKQTPESVYLLAGTIISDPIYSQRFCARALGVTTEDGSPADTQEMGPTVLSSMTEAERAALRRRVLKHWGQ